MKLKITISQTQSSMDGLEKRKKRKKVEQNLPNQNTEKEKRKLGKRQLKDMKERL